MSPLPNGREKEPIAIVGMGCRFPGNANTPESFWQLLMAEIDAVGEAPANRWDQRQFYHPDPTRPGKMYTPLGTYLERYDQFDAAFFGISPMEAQQIDPQQRLLLETSWEALEDAGLVPSTLAGSQTGVFIGIFTGDYGVTRRQNVATINAYTNGGGSYSIVANRISYLFDFHGPSFSVDTACSSSLVGVHLACESLWRGECSLAIAGGVQLNLDPGWSIGFCKAQMLSPSGRCHTFDAKADGYVRGEGVGVVVLKPLAQALADGNPVHAVIRMTGINQDGKTPSLHQPSRTAQEGLLRQIYTQAGIDPKQVYYVEAHGTGTQAGDRIEATALGSILGKERAEGEWLRIGSVKTNIGHLEGAAGIAGLIKAILILKHRQIPANLHFQTPNPDIPFDQLHLKVLQASEAIPTDISPLVAGVNSFGFGGTNAHVVLQEFRTPAVQVETSSDQRPYLLPLSARSPEALRDLAHAYLEKLHADTALSLRDVCYSASLCREHHAYRLALMVQSQDDLREKLEAFLAGEKYIEIASGYVAETSAPKIAFVYAGNGPQWWAMGRQLLQQEPLFREVVERCDQALRRYTDWSLMEELLADEAHSRMHCTDVAQPALFALQIALTDLWKAWGITPQAVIGHSVGEIAAAYIAGILSFEDAIQVVFQRSRWQEMTAGTGKMLAAGISAEDAAQLILPYEGRVALASVNSPSSVTFSGEETALEEIMAVLRQREVFCRYLALNYAFHSHYMNPIREDLIASLADLHPQQASLPFVSTVAGRVLTGQECDAVYWWDNIRQPVQFSTGIRQLLATNTTIFLEVGPHPVLSSYITECMATEGKQGTVLPSLRRMKDERRSLLTSLGTLYTHGCVPHWDALAAGGNYVPLPLYPWQQQHYWIEAKSSGVQMHKEYTHPLLGYRLSTAEAAWENTLDTQLLPYLADHLIQQTIIFPAAGYIEMALAAAVNIFEDKAYAIEQMDIHKPLVLTQTQIPIVQTVVATQDHAFHIYSRQQEEQTEWTLHVSGSIRHLEHIAPTRTIDLNEVRQRCKQEIAGPQVYQHMARRGLQYGPHFQTVEQVVAGVDEAVGVIHWPESLEEQNADYFIHPLLLDGCIQIIFSILAAPREVQQDQTYLPVGLEHFCYYRRPSPGTRLYGYVHMVKRGRDYGKAYYALLDEEENLIMEITGLRIQAVRSIQTAQTALIENDIYETCWLPSAQQGPHGSLPAPTQLLASLQSDIVQVNQEGSTGEVYQQRIQLLEQLCSAYITTALRQLGWNFQLGSRFHTATLRGSLGIAEQYEQLLSAWCMQLVADAILKRENDEWLVVSTPEERKPEALLRKILLECPDSQADALLAARYGEQLAEILTGECDPLSLLLSEETARRVEHLYESGLRHRKRNRLFQIGCKRLLEQSLRHRLVRILHIGASTSGTAAYVFPLLLTEGVEVEYVFADVSENVLQSARQKYRDYPFVSYQVLDIAQDPLQQGFEAHAFDLIIATDVFHTTGDIRKVLSHTLHLLASEGLLYFSDVTASSYWTLLTYGVLKSYWHFQDRDRRPVQPPLNQQEWLSLLNEVGFIEVVPLTHTDGADWTVFLAQGPTLQQQKELVQDEITTGTWLIFADDGGIALQVKEQLAVHASNIIVVEKGTHYQRIDAQLFRLRAQSPEDMQQLFDILDKEECQYEHIVYMWGLDIHTEENVFDSLNVAVDMGCIGLLSCVKAVATAENHPAPHIRVVTSGVHVLPETQEHPTTEQAPLYGLARVIGNEHPELQCTLIDLSAPGEGKDSYDREEIRALSEELLQAAESEVLLRGSARFINRIMHAPLERRLPTHEVLKQPEMSFRLDMQMLGVLDHLALRTVPRIRPKPGEVEIAVAAAGLDIKDMMVAMGVIAGEALELGYAGGFALGLDCAGTIEAVGEGITDLQIGDEVMALGRNCFSPYVTTDARLVVRKPANISFEESATIPMTFLTAYYALHIHGRIRKGERVLIHSAADGVGLAAMQIVQQAGGEVFATAGSPEKRAYLRTLGVQHVLDSRSLAFADEIMQMTNGEGVDIVLNSLAGEAMEKSLHVLRSFGRFLEIGKRDMLEKKKLELLPFQHCLSYSAIDSDQLAYRDKQLVQEVMCELKRSLECGTYHPLPYRLFLLSQVKDAFQYLQQSQHIGKIVISMQQPALVQHVPQKQALTLCADASYLITGGVSGFGLATAQWMVKQGARALVLVNRSGKVTPEAAQIIEEMRAVGTQVLVAGADVTQEQEIEGLLEQIQTTLPPLRGVVHAAMVMEDSSILNLTEASMKRVIAPKMLGAWNLHVQTRALALDFFVLYSSISAEVGNPGQGNYAAANMFLNALSFYRQAQGLPALAVEWGALAKVGYVARHGETESHLARRGVHTLSPEQALDTLGQLLQESRPLVTVAKIDWKQVNAILLAPIAQARLTRLLLPEEEEQGEKEASLTEETTLDPQQRLQVHLRQALTKILNVSSGDIDLQSTSRLQLDSLMVMELRNSIKQNIGLDIPVLPLASAKSLSELSTFVSKQWTANIVP